MGFGDRRPRPDAQVLAALTDAKRLGLPFDEAWALATDGHVCDSYSSARGTGGSEPQPPLDGAPPNLRASTGQKRCAGCRHVTGPGDGIARCQLYGLPVFSGVLWPHRTGDRHEWRNALLGDRLEDGDEAGVDAWQDVEADTGSRPEWRAAYEDAATPYSLLHEMVREQAAAEGATVYGPLVTGGTLAA